MNDKYFVFITTVQASEDTYSYLYEIADGTVVEFNEDLWFDFDSLRWYYGEGEWDYNITYMEVYDPENVKVSFRNDVIGTNFVSAIFAFTEDCNIKQVSKYRDFTSRWELTLKTDFKAGMIDPELMFGTDSEAPGEFDMEVELKAGDKIYLEKTDGKRQVFFSTESGEWGTFMMDDPETGGYCHINGVHATEIFDGIGFAD